MKYIIILFLILGLFSISYADRVCLEKATGKLIEYQSGGSTQKDLDVMIQNAVNSGYIVNDIEAKFVTNEEWQIMKKKWIDDPAEKEKQQQELIKKQKKDAIKLKLNLTEEDWKNLKEAIK